MPLPLLRQHDINTPIGMVTALMADGDELRFEAVMSNAHPDPDAPANRVWAELCAG